MRIVSEVEMDIKILQRWIFFIRTGTSISISIPKIELSHRKTDLHQR